MKMPVRDKSFSRWRLLLFTSRMVLTAWFFWIVFTVSIIGIDLIQGQVGSFRQYIIYAASFVAIYSVVCAILVFSHRCDNCEKVLLAEYLEKHKNFKARKYLGGWGTVVVDVVLTRKFTCMHCGTRYRVE